MPDLTLLLRSQGRPAFRGTSVQKKEEGTGEGPPRQPNNMAWQCVLKSQGRVRRPAQQKSQTRSWVSGSPCLGGERGGGSHVG